MITLTRKFLYALIIAWIIGIVGYCLYFDYKDRVEYNNCMQSNSLDVERQDQLEQYCWDLARDN